MKVNYYQTDLYGWFLTPTNHVAKFQSMKWTGSVRRIENPIQSKWIWIGLD